MRGNSPDIETENVAVIWSLIETVLTSLTSKVHCQDLRRTVVFDPSWQIIFQKYHDKKYHQKFSSEKLTFLLKGIVGTAQYCRTFPLHQVHGFQNSSSPIFRNNPPFSFNIIELFDFTTPFPFTLHLQWPLRYGGL